MSGLGPAGRPTAAVLHLCARRRRVLCGAVVVLIGLSSAGSTAFGQAAPQPQRETPRSVAQMRLSFAPVVERTAPAVVNVFTEKTAAAAPPSLLDDPFFRQFFGDATPTPPTRRRMENALGSGVIVRADGLIVTNNHVIEEADAVRVVLHDRREFSAEVIARDANADLALLDIEAGTDPLPVLPFGDADALAVGDLVLAIGNPFGVGQTVTSGIVSATGRSAPEVRPGVTFIQTDAAINPGNSGGALVTLDGELIGINTAIFSRSGGSVGIGFAIPSDLVEALIRSSDRGSPDLERPWVGVVVQAVEADMAAGLGLARPQGVLVDRLYPGGPAEKAGLAVGDVILAVDGVPVDSPSAIVFRFAIGDPGREVTLHVLREGKRWQTAIALGPAPFEPTPDETTLDGRQPLAGARVANMSPAWNMKIGLDPFARGVVVSAVAPGSPAQRLRLRPGDRIEQVNEQPVGSVAALKDLLAVGSTRWQIQIEREGRSLNAVVPG